MTTLTVNTHSEQEKKVLMAFLDSLQYDYEADDIVDYQLSKAQEREILRRDKAFETGQTTARNFIRQC